MNILLAAFLVLYGSIVYVSARSESELRDLANNITERIRVLRVSVDDVKNKTKQVPDKENEVVNSIDFGLPNDPQIIKVQHVLDEHKDNINYAICTKLKENNEKNLIQELKDIFTYEVNTRLKQIGIEVGIVSQVLFVLDDHLHGTNLETEIKLCVDNEKCYLVDRYPVQVDKMEESLKILNEEAPSTIDHVLKTNVYPVVPEKIKYQIYEPVIRCLDHKV